MTVESESFKITVHVIVCTTEPREGAPTPRPEKSSPEKPRTIMKMLIEAGAFLPGGRDVLIGHERPREIDPTETYDFTHLRAS